MSKTETIRLWLLNDEGLYNVMRDWAAENPRTTKTWNDFLAETDIGEIEVDGVKFNDPDIDGDYLLNDIFYA